MRLLKLSFPILFLKLFIKYLMSRHTCCVPGMCCRNREKIIQFGIKEKDVLPINVHRS